MTVYNRQKFSWRNPSNNTLNISGRKTFPLVYGSRTKGKESGIQCLEVDGRKRTVVGAHPIINGRKEMAIVSNEPGDVATTGERI